MQKTIGNWAMHTLIQHTNDILYHTTSNLTVKFESRKTQITLNSNAKQLLITLLCMSFFVTCGEMQGVAILNNENVLCV